MTSWPKRCEPERAGARPNTLWTSGPVTERSSFPWPCVWPRPGRESGFICWTDKTSPRLPHSGNLKDCWGAECVITDVFEWARQILSKPVEVVVANLFLHHFANAQLVELFRAAANRARLLVAVEPRRTLLPLCCSRSLWLVGCNAITRHDAVASVRAGFVGRELSALWPVGGEWILTEKSTGVFSHVFSARRRE